MKGRLYWQTTVGYSTPFCYPNTHELFFSHRTYLTSPKGRHCNTPYDYNIQPKTPWWWCESSPSRLGREYKLTFPKGKHAQHTAGTVSQRLPNPASQWLWRLPELELHKVICLDSVSALWEEPPCLLSFMGWVCAFCAIILHVYISSGCWRMCPFLGLHHL